MKALWFEEEQIWQNNSIICFSWCLVAATNGALPVENAANRK